MFQVVHGVDAQGKVVLYKQVTCASLVAFLANLSSCLVGIDACGSAHFWASKPAAQGHVVKLMAPQFVKPYVKVSKTDAADGEAICEAVSHSNMRFVPVPIPEQQALLAVRQAAVGFAKARTTQANRLCDCRSFRLTSGVIVRQSLATITGGVVLTMY